MVECAALLVDEVLPIIPIRLWSDRCIEDPAVIEKILQNMALKESASLPRNRLIRWLFSNAKSPIDRVANDLLCDEAR